MKKSTNVKINNVGATSSRPHFEESAKRKNKGITLIALIITIIVMLILVAVSISIALNTGLFESAGKATKDWKTAQDAETNMKMNIAGQEYSSVDAYLETMKGIENKSITVVSSLQEIKFENTIKEYNIANTKEGYSTYEIKGISLTKNGEYITTGSLAGKSGNLEIVGDIKDTTFQYNLTSMMKGDEVFYCKVNIDGEEYFQELKVIQGDSVRYEEDYLILTDAIEGSDGIGQWIKLEDEIWSGGSALKVKTDSQRGHVDRCATLEFEFRGSAIELIVGQDEQIVGFMAFSLYNEQNEQLVATLLISDVYQGEIAEWKVLENLENLENNLNYKTFIKMGYMSLYDTFEAGFEGMIIDSVVIYR